jgi:hypothetical protein
MVVWGAGHVPGAVLLLMGFWLYVTFDLGCLVVWMVGSLVAWAVRKQGQQQAAILRELLASKTEAVSSAAANVALKPTASPRAPQPTATRGSPAARATGAGAPSNGALNCQVCGRLASSFCTAHGVPVCETHVNTHDKPQCSYVPSGRVQVVSALSAQPAQSERKPASSILGLG